MIWDEIALAYSQVATNHERQVTVTSDAEGLVAVVMYDAPTDSVLVSVMAARGKTTGKEILKDATDRS